MKNFTFPAYSDERRLYYITNSQYLTHIFLLKGWENVCFELAVGVKGLDNISCL